MYYEVVSNNLDILIDDIQEDSIVLGTDGRVASVYTFALSPSDINLKSLLGSSHYYNDPINGKRDSSLYYSYNRGVWEQQTKKIFERFPDKMTTHFLQIFGNGRIQLDIRKDTLIGDQERLKNNFSYQINNLDTIIIEMTECNYIDSTMICNSTIFDEDGTIDYRSKDSLLYLDNFETISSKFDYSNFSHPIDTLFKAGSKKYFYSENISSIKPENKPYEIVIFPNPANESIEIKTIDNKTLELGEYQIFDIYGRYIEIGKIRSSPISLYGLAPGNYFIRFKNGVTKPFIFQK